MAKPWLLDELAYAGPEHVDPEFVRGYDQKQGQPDPSDDLTALEAHGLGADSSVLDMGAGTGQFAISAAQRFGRLTAVDVSPVMVATLRDRATGLRLSNLDVMRGGFLSFDAPDASFDGAHSRNALHHLPDFWKALALARLARLLRPGGVLRLRDLVYDFAPSDADAVLDAWLARAASDPALGYTRDDLADHIRTEFSTFRWLLEPMLDAAGFEIESSEFSGRVFAAYTCRRR